MKQIAALFVATDGCYFGIDGIDPWDVHRDARLYAGPHPVVAHPPCARWCRLAGLVEARWGHKRGDDGGCFAAALESVRKYGGVLEHPAYSDAWPAFGLPEPNSHGGWTRSLFDPGWSCHIEQCWYGHKAAKPTWLYSVGCDLPNLLWGKHPNPTHVVGARSNQKTKKQEIKKSEREPTPHAFRDVLIAMARSVA